MAAFATSLVASVGAWGLESEMLGSSGRYTLFVGISAPALCEELQRWSEAANMKPQVSRVTPTPRCQLEMPEAVRVPERPRRAACAPHAKLRRL